MKLVSKNKLKTNTKTNMVGGRELKEEGWVEDVAKWWRVDVVNQISTTPLLLVFFQHKIYFQNFVTIFHRDLIIDVKI
jgi:hypothetical protein